MATSHAHASASGSQAAQWYYWLTNDPQGILPDGWYEYESTLNQTVEQYYQAHLAVAAPHQRGARSGTKRARHLVPYTANSGFRYELDFQRMTQRNMTSNRERPIQRTDNGMPPPLAPNGTAIAAPVAAAAAAALPVAYAHVVPGAVAVPGAGRRARRSRHAGGGTDDETINYEAPEILHEVHVDEAKVFEDAKPPAGKPKADGDDEKKQESYTTSNHGDDCAICLELLWDASHGTGPVVCLKGCRHQFHKDCILDSLKHSGTKCPLCSKAIHQEQDSQTSKGKCPSGTMTVVTDTNTSCAGFPDANGTLTIMYRIHGGVQKSYHPHPGVRFSGAHRTAYLPNNPQGQELLARMKYAFSHGLSFMVGTSLTTGQANVVTWASIHHKTSPNGGAFGFPDATYFDRSNDEMNALGVPDAAQCRQWLQNNV